MGVFFALTLAIVAFSLSASAARVKKDVEIFACNYCGEKFDSASALNEHGCIAISTPDDEVVETGEEKPTTEHKVEKPTESATKPETTETKTEPVTEPSTTKPAEKTKDAVEEEVTEVKVIAITEPETRPITPEVPEEPHVEIPVEPEIETTEPEIPEEPEVREIKLPEKIKIPEIKVPDLSEIKVPDLSGIASNMLDVELPGSESKNVKTKSATNQTEVLGTEEALITEVPDIPFTGSANSPLWACTSLAVASGAIVLLLKKKNESTEETETED